MNEIKARILRSIVDYPSNIAIESSQITLSYSEMSNYVNAYISKINSKCHGSIENKYVLIYIHSPMEAIIAQIAILLSGGICVPFDRQTPLAYYSIDRITDIACMITDDYEFQQQINFPVLRITEIEDRVSLENTGSAINISKTSSENAYCIMTSGSTGVPKAVVLKQIAVVNQVDAKIEILNMNSTSKICFYMNLSFVAAIWQVLATFFVGGTLVVFLQD